jgi:hypothetical protein
MKAIDPRLADEVRAINAAFTKALEAYRKSLPIKPEPDTKAPPAKGDGPIKVATFEC